MARIIASVGRSQLGRIDLMNNKRKVLWGMLKDAPGIHYDPQQNGSGSEPVFNFIVLRCKTGSIDDFMEKAHKNGIYLRPSWPRRQRPWEGQDSESYRKFGDCTLVWSIGPDLSQGEVREFIRFVTGSQP